MAIGDKLKERRKKRKAENKWVLGEKFSKAGRKRSTARKSGKQLKKAGITVNPATLRESGKVRKGVKGVELTGNKAPGKVYPKYEKKSKAAGSFKEAFKKGCGSSESGTFNWDGRSYSCKRAQPTKKQKLARISKAAKKMPTGSS